ncbi:allophanate hydrolase [Roseospira goensis]|uniref:Allophanate hydrolase n=1 Tax=Roseospira goensis TaxID=391922 RepID=A0A7W6RZ43_9PROT|nr:allophanate hydrolase [Roseospira goensis]MBB4285878.1 allophanate hydrolase [Roseospira goensis]
MPSKFDTRALDLGVLALRAAYAAGTQTPEAVINAVYDRIDRSPDPAVWIALTPRAEALARARAVPLDAPLAGIPFAVKDNLDAEGLETTAGCPVYRYRPERGAFVVDRLLEAGAILVGKTNLDQFATGLVGTRSPYGAPRCVFDERYISGGSSSGSAVAVAAGLVSFALGTDTAGSGRVPAAFNNIVGLKPTRGLLSTAGVVPACRSLDCVSIFSLTCADGDAVRRVVEGFDPADPWSRPARSRPLPLEAPAVGVLAPADRDFCGDAATAALYEDAVARAEGLGWTIREIDCGPFREAARLLYAGPWVAERAAAVGGFIAAHRADCDPTVAGIILDGPAPSAVDAFQGIYALKAHERACAAVWTTVDALLLPTAPTQYTVEAVKTDPVALNATLGLYTNFVNLLDLAAVAVPAGFTPGGLAFGVTLIAPAFTDAALAVLGDRLHRALGLGAGRDRVPVPALVVQDAPDLVDLAVVGAHLSGMPLNHQLTDRGAVLVETTRTARDYRLYALAGTVPPKPGLVRDPGFIGPGILAEVWRMTQAAFGAFVEEVPPPLAIGTMDLADGRRVKGFVCEPAAIAGGEDITDRGGWRQYLTGV